MRSNLRILVAVAVALLVAPVAMAESVEEQLQLMNERMQQLENQLQSTQDELDASMDEVDRQQDVMEKAGLERQGQSGLSSFYQSVEISGWLAGSWFWNFNDPTENALANQNLSNFAGNSINGGRGNNFYPFHPDHNSFSVDQLWFEMQKPATEESRAGFRADFVYGKTASILSNGFSRVCGRGNFDQIDDDTEACQGDDGSDFSLYQAYIEYLTPWGPSVKVGKFETWLGAEKVPTVYNLNITRGVAFSFNQPINHYGVAIEGTNVVDWGIAVTNDFDGISPDNNNGKHVMAKLGYSAEMFSGQIAMIWGQDVPGDSCHVSGAFGCSLGVVDLLLQVDPMENFTAYLNYDYGWREGSGTLGLEGHTVSLAGRYGFTETLGFALRGEWAQDVDNKFGINNVDPVTGDTEIFGITGTLDWTITDGLVLKAEVRYDYLTFNPNGPSNVFARGASDTDETIFDDDSLFTRRSQVTTGLELVYQF